MRRPLIALAAAVPTACACAAWAGDEPLPGAWGPGERDTVIEVAAMIVTLDAERPFAPEGGAVPFGTPLLSTLPGSVRTPYGESDLEGPDVRLFLGHTEARSGPERDRWRDVAIGAAIGEAAERMLTKPLGEDMKVAPWATRKAAGVRISGRF